MGMEQKNLFILIFFLMVFFISACSNKTMSFFFDGVPNNSDSLNLISNDASFRGDSVRADEVSAQSGAPAYNVHPPYLEKNCTACHDQNAMGKFVEPQPALCYQCHEDFATGYKILHAPVEGGECTACHSPHMAKDEKLLIRDNQEICFFCHDRDDILKQPNHEGIENTACTDCHNPHGSNEEHLLY